MNSHYYCDMRRLEVVALIRFQDSRPLFTRVALTGHAHWRREGSAETDGVTNRATPGRQHHVEEQPLFADSEYRAAIQAMP